MKKQNFIKSHISCSDSKEFVIRLSEMVNHNANIFAWHWETKAPIFKAENVEIHSNSSNAWLKDEAQSVDQSWWLSDWKRSPSGKSGKPQKKKWGWQERQTSAWWCPGKPDQGWSQGRRDQPSTLVMRTHADVREQGTWHPLKTKEQVVEEEAAQGWREASVREGTTATGFVGGSPSIADPWNPHHPSLA
jgi:hypothetical protein